MSTDDLAALLAEHSMYSYVPKAKGYVCDCGVTIFRTPEDADADVSLLGKHTAHQAEVIAAAGWTTHRAVIEELIAKAENGPTDGTNDPHAAYWLRAELGGEG